MRSIPSCWNKTLAQLGFKRRRRKVSKRPDFMRRRSLFESLEPRQMLTVQGPVDTLLDVVDAGDPYYSLREAITDANIDQDADVITFQPGLTGTIELSGSQLTLSKNVTITGPGAELLTIDANADASNQRRAFFVATGVAASLEGLTITGAYTSSGGGIYNAQGNLTLNDVVVEDNFAAAGVGGGIYSNSGSLYLTDTVVANNQATSAGGGIYVSSDGDDIVQITDSKIVGNASTVNGSGGGLYAIKNDELTSFQVTVENTVVSDNSTVGAGSVGGGIYFNDGTDGTVVNSVIANNQSPGAGGGIYSDSGILAIEGTTVQGNVTVVSSGGAIYQNSGVLELSNSEITHNKAAASGGGVFNSLGSLLVERSSISHNSATVHGGGIHINAADGAPLEITGSTIANNHVESAVANSVGGGVYVWPWESGSREISFTNSTISNNFSSYRGGGVYLTHNGTAGSVKGTFVNSTVTENVSAVEGGGVFVSDQADPALLHNTILAGNTAGGSLPDFRGAMDTNSSYNLFGAGGDPFDITENVFLDPGEDVGLTALGNHGGPTLTHVPLPGRRAHNAGSNAQAASKGLQNDQRGFLRYYGGLVDIGAVELSWPLLQGADFNGDGREDKLFLDYQVTGALQVLQGAAGSPIIETWATFNTPIFWNHFLTGDFNGDGRDDFALEDGATGWSLYLSDSSQFVPHHTGVTTPGWNETYAGDFDGDGVQEVLGWNDTAGQWDVLYFNEYSGATVETDWGNQLHGVGMLYIGDANRDGRDDLIVDNGSSWQVSLSQPATGASGTFATAGNWGDWFDGQVTGGKLDADAPIQKMIDIFSDVYNTIELELYPGLMKGITATKQTKAGNPWDQAALLVDELEQAGFDADIATGRVRIDFPHFEELNKWLGVENAAAAFYVIQSSMDGNAVPRDANGGNSLITGNPFVAIEFTHAWVSVRVPTSTGFDFVELDPSWKFKDRQEGLDLGTTNFNVSNPQGLFDEYAYLSLDPSEDHRLPLEFFEDETMAYLQENYPGRSLADLSHDGPIITKTFDTIPAGLGEGVEIVDAGLPGLGDDVTVYGDAEEIYSNPTLSAELTHRVDVLVEREIVSSARAASLEVAAAPGESLGSNDADAPGTRIIDLSGAALSYSVGGPSDNGNTTYNFSNESRQINGTKHVILSNSGSYTVTSNTRMLVTVEPNAAAVGHKLVFGWDRNATFNGSGDENVAAAPLSSGMQTFSLPPGVTGYNLDGAVLGLQHNDHYGGTLLPTSASVTVSQVLVYEELPGSASIVLDGDENKNIWQQGSHYFTLDVSSLDYRATKNTYLEFEFKNISTGTMHAIGWDVDGTSHNDQGQASKRYKLAGTASTYPLANPVETLSDGYKRYRIQLGANFGSTQSELVSRLIFYTEATSTSRQSYFRNISLVTDTGVDGEQLSHSLVVPSSSLLAINLDYEKTENSPETILDDTYRPRLTVGGQIADQGTTNEVFQVGDKAHVKINHFAPTKFYTTEGLAGANRQLSFTRDPGELVAIGLDANQHSRESLDDLKEDLLTALDTGITEGDHIEDIPELLAYTVANYWHRHGSDNKAIAALTGTISAQQWVGSGIASAKSQLLRGENDNYVIDHLPYSIAPLDMGVDLPNANNPHYSALTGLNDSEARQLRGYHTSALEHTVVEEVVNVESISTIKGLQRAFQKDQGINVNGMPISSDAVYVLESRWEAGSRNVYRVGTWNKDTQQTQNIPLDEHFFLDTTAPTGVLRSHVGHTDIGAELWTLLSTALEEDGTIRVLVPFGRTKLDQWIGAIYIVDRPNSQLFAIQKDGQSPAAGGFATGLPQPQNFKLPEYNFTYATYAGDPVNVANGNMFRDDVDIVFPNVGVPLDFARHYDSQSDDDVGMGVGWTYSFGDLLFEDPEDSNKLIWLTSSGQRHTFEDLGGGQYLEPAALHGTFTKSGATYFYKDKSGMDYHFESVTFSQNSLDVRGRLKKVIDNIGNGVEVVYEGAGTRRIASVQDVHTSGRRLELDYNANGVVSQIRKVVGGATEGMWDYTYVAISGTQANSNQRLTGSLAPSVTSIDANGDEIPGRPTVAYAYIPSGVNKGVMESITEPDSSSHAYEYYPNGRTFRVTDNQGHEQTFNYNLFRNLTEFTDENGNTEIYIHQDNGLLNRQIHEDRTRQIYTWGDDDSLEEFLMTSSTDEVGATQTFTYYGPTDFRYRELYESTSPHYTDAAGVPLELASVLTTRFDYTQPDMKPHMINLAEIIVDPGGTPITTTSIYDNLGRLIKATDGMGNVTKYGYYDQQEPLPHMRDLLKTVTGPRGNDTSDTSDVNREYVPWKELTEITITGDTIAVRVVYGGAMSGNVIADAVRIERADTNNPFPFTRIIDNDVDDADSRFDTEGSVTYFQQMPWGYEGDYMVLNAAGETATWIFSGLEPGTYRVSTTWPGSGSNWSAVPYEVAANTNFSGAIQPPPVDQTSGPIDFTAGFETVFTYDDAGNVTSAVTDNLPTPQNTYDHTGNLVTSTDPEGIVSHFVYDVLGRQLAAEVYPEGLPGSALTSTFAYDAAGRVRFSFDPLGNKTEFQYDAKGNLDKQINPDGTFVQFEYDGFGNRTSQTDELGRTTRFVYDSRHRLVQTIHPDGASERVRYTGVGQVASSFDARGNETKFEYDSAGRLTSTTNAKDYTATNEYDLLGRLEASIDYKLQQTEFKYDKLGRLTETRVLPAGGGGTLVALSTIDYDAAGNVVREAVYDTVGLGLTTGAFSADPRTLITAANLADNLVQVTETSYDSLNRPVETFFRGTNASSAVRTVYDNAGRLLYTYDELGHKTKRQYDEYGRLSAIVAPKPNGLQPNPTTRFEYDASGNRTAVVDPNGNRTEFQYDVFNRVVTTIDALGGRQRSVYDVAGQLVATVDALGRAAYTVYDSRGRVKQIYSPVPDVDSPLPAPRSTLSYDAAGNLKSQVDPQGFETRYEYNELNQLIREEFDVSYVVDDADSSGFTFVGTEATPNGQPGYDGGYKIINPGASSARADWEFTGLPAGTYRIGITWDEAAAESTNGTFRVMVDGVNQFFEYNVDQTQPADDFYRYDQQAWRGWEDVDNGSSLYLEITGSGTYTLKVRHVAQAGKVLVADAVRLERVVARTYTYDNNGNLETETDTLGHTTTYEYDELDRVKTTTLPDPEGDEMSGLPAPLTTTFYDGYGNVIRTVEHRGGGIHERTTEWEYDARNRVVTETLDAGGIVAVTTKFTYDAVGNLTEQFDDFEGINARTTFSYDNLDRVKGETRFRSASDVYGIDTFFTYDANGNLLSSQTELIQSVPNAIHSATTRFTYDALNRQTSVSRPALPPMLTEYDAVGNVLAETDELGRTTTYEYDRLDRLTKTTAPDPDGPGSLLSPVSLFSYDLVGNLIAQTNGEGETEQFAYDELGRLVSSEDGEGHETRTTYDSEGNRLTYTDPRGDVTRYEYDDLNRLKKEIINLDGDDVSRTYTYNAQGNLQEIIDRNERRQWYVYDNLDRQTVAAWYNATGPFEHGLSWQYDALGRVTLSQDFDEATGDSQVQSFDYDHFGRVTEARNFDPTGVIGSSAPKVKQEYEYDVLGISDSHLVQTKYSQYTVDGSTPTLVGSSTIFSDRRGRPTRIEDTAVGGGAKEIQFSYNSTDQLTGIARTSGGIALDSQVSYDQAGRLTSLVHDLPNDIGHYYTYDLADRIVNFSSTGSGVVSRGYEYDEAGQVTSASGIGNEAFSYDANGNRTTGTEVGPYNRLLEDDDWTYEYDNEGNLTKRTLKAIPGLATEYTYDHRNRLTRVDDTYLGTITSYVSYAYNADNQRVRRSVDPDGEGLQGTEVEHFVYDATGDLTLSLDGAGQLEHRYLYGPAADQVLADETFDAAGSPDELLWLLADHQGTIRDIVDDNGVKRKTIRYSAAGKVIGGSSYDKSGQLIPPSHAEAVDVLFSYTGLMRDAKTGFLRADQRDYDPDTGRWTSEDPIGFADGANLYRYGGNSYPNTTDPTGLSQAGNPLNNLFNSGPTYSAQQLFGGPEQIRVTRDFQAGPLETGLAIAGNLDAVQRRREATLTTLGNLQSTVERGYQGTGRNRRKIDPAAYERDIRNQQLVLRQLDSDVRLFSQQLQEGFQNTVVPPLPLGRDDNRQLPGGVGPQAIVQRYYDDKNVAALSRVDGLGFSASPPDFLAAGAPGILRGSLSAALYDVAEESLSSATGLPVIIPRRGTAPSGVVYDPYPVAGPNPNALRQRVVVSPTAGEGGVYLRPEAGRTKVGSTGDFRDRYGPTGGIEVEIPQTRTAPPSGVNDSAYRWTPRAQRRFDEEYIYRITPDNVRYKAPSTKSPVSQSNWEQYRQVFGYGDLPADFGK